MVNQTEAFQSTEHFGYNHHFLAWIRGENSQMIRRADNRDIHHTDNHGASQPWVSVAVDDDPNPDSHIPTSQFFSEGNGGEYRKSYHGYPEGYAQLIEFPRWFEIQPMQIDTKNRFDHGTAFKAGALPRNSAAPPNATYSVLE